MNTRHAQIVLTTLRAGSFTAAARALYITQPTLSQTVKQIESQLGEPIFMRGHTPLTLTPAGEIYVQAARRMLQIETQLDEAISQLRGRTQGLLRTGVMLHRSGELLPQVLPGFLSTYPDMRLEIREGTASELTRMLVDSEIDMALIIDPVRHPDLEYRTIAEDEIVLLAGRKTELAQRFPSGSVIDLAHARGERFILPSQGGPSRPYYDTLLDAFGLHPIPFSECDSLETARRLCINCSMVMLSPFISLLCDGPSMQKLAHYHLGTQTHLPSMYLVSRKDTPLSPCAQTLFTMLSNRFRAMTAYRE